MKVMNDRIRSRQDIEAVVRALDSGLIFVDVEGEVLATIGVAAEELERGLERLQLPLRRTEDAVDCFISFGEVPVNGHARSVGIVQLQPPRDRDAGDAEDHEQAPTQHADLHDLIEEAIADIMADAWFAEALTDKLKAWCQRTQPALRSSAIDSLTARERETLGLICEGRTDAEMGQLLNLSHNTVRNHVASLFRKIGVNRRSAAIIWARERGITRYDIRSAPRQNRSSRHTS